jgi:leader peptidase (prepilin peptidase)/N-methyltransferase
VTRLRLALGLGLVGLLVACFVHYGFTARSVLAAFFMAVLVAVSAVDIERRIIPNVIVLPATAIVLVARIAIAPGHTVEWVVAGLAVFLFFLVANLVYPAGMGMGDVKLALLLGVALGRYVGVGLLVGSLAAALLSIGILIRYGRAGRKKAIPFGPFLALGAIVAVFASWP